MWVTRELLLVLYGNFGREHLLEAGIISLVCVLLPVKPPTAIITSGIQGMSVVLTKILNAACVIYLKEKTKPVNTT